MLIDSPRFKPGDLDVWRKLERYDEQLADSPQLGQRAQQARQVLEKFVHAGPAYVSTSWGKDSTVLAHLLAVAGTGTPLVWVRVEKWENPECFPVRDEFLRRFDVNYHEIVHESTAPRWWDEPASFTGRERTSRGGFKVAEKRFGARHVSGVRGEESRMRGMVMARWGEAGPAACRPIGRWSAVDVFAYLRRHDLPIHPAYAMSFAGKLDRRWLRVSSLGGVRGADQHRADWELAYYPDVVSPEARAALTKGVDR